MRCEIDVLVRAEACVQYCLCSIWVMDSAVSLFLTQFLQQIFFNLPWICFFHVSNGAYPVISVSSFLHELEDYLYAHAAPWLDSPLLIGQIFPDIRNHECGDRYSNRGRE